jgi:ADP-ribose pyrophosphatase
VGRGRRPPRPQGVETVEEVTLARQRIYDGRVVNLRVDTVRLANGRTATREVVEHAAAVAIVAVDPTGALLLVRQWRTPTGRALLEVPAGTLDPGEAPEAAAQRELQEETGYRAGRLTRLGGFWVAPGYCTEYIHVYLAEDLIESRLTADEDEHIAVERVTLAEALALIDAGEIDDAKSQVGLLRYARRA